MKRRNLIFVTLASIFTLGIYDIYWAFSTRNELVKKGYNVPSPWIALAPLLGLLIVAAAQVLVRFALSTNGVSNFSGLTATLNILSVLVGIFSIIGILPMLVYWTWQYSKAVQEVTKGALTTELSMVLAIVATFVGVGFLWTLVVQYYLNQQPQTAAS